MAQNWGGGDKQKQNNTDVVQGEQQGKGKGIYYNHNHNHSMTTWRPVMSVMKAQQHQYLSSNFTK